MAIKTKKISDLSELTLAGGSDLEAADFYVLGCKSGVTGKVSVASIVTAIHNAVHPSMPVSVEQQVATVDVVETTSVSSEIVDKMANDISKVSTDVTSLEDKVKNIETKQKNYAFTTTKKLDAALESIAQLNAKVAVLEGFVKALQADGYLTLANIKKAAADACPIETPAE